jgi:hypothetical protein
MSEPADPDTAAAAARLPADQALARHGCRRRARVLARHRRRPAPRARGRPAGGRLHPGRAARSRRVRAARRTRLRTARTVLCDFRHRPVLGLYCRQYRKLLALEKRLREHGVDVYEADVRPPERYLMERFITAPVLFTGTPAAGDAPELLLDGQLKPDGGYRPPCAPCRSTSRRPCRASCARSRWKAAASARCTCWGRRTATRPARLRLRSTATPAWRCWTGWRRGSGATIRTPSSAGA